MVRLEIDPDRPRQPRLHRNPRCARCGYALGGVVDRWRDRCPLEGTCSECGLTFDWVDVFDPRRLQPRWCVEFGSTWSAPGRFVRTLARTFTPWWFWGVRMSHPLRWHRLAAYVVVLLALTYFVFAGTHAWRRAAAYPQFMVPITGGNALRAVAPEVRIAEGWKAFAAPASMTGRRVAWQGLTLLTRSPRYELQRRFHSWYAVRRSARYVASSMALGLLMPLLFATMPVTRKRCKVTWGHVVRVAAYSLPLVLAPLWVLLVVYDVGPRDTDRWIIWLGLVFTPAALGAWWYAALRCYLKLPQAAWTAGLFTLIGVLGLLAAGYFDLASFELFEAMYAR